MPAYPALANSAAALSAARFRKILLILDTLGAVVFVQTPVKGIKMFDNSELHLEFGIV